MAKEFTGATHEVEVPFIPAESWTKGKVFKGVVDELDDSNPAFGLSYVMSPEAGHIEIGGVKYQQVRLGNLTGLELAFKAAREKGMPDIAPGVILTVECIGVKKSRSKDMSDRPNFSISAVFPDY